MKALFGKEKEKEVRASIARLSLVLFLVSSTLIAIDLILYFLTNRGNSLIMEICMIVVSFVLLSIGVYVGLAGLKPQIDEKRFMRSLDDKTTLRSYPKKASYTGETLRQNGLEFLLIKLEFDDKSTMCLLPKGEEVALEEDNPTIIYLVDRFIVGWEKES